MAAKRISASDVAQKAGVSRTTVSFVLNNTPGKGVSEDTRQKVLKIAAELNYTPNEGARSLALLKHHSIGIFICHTHFVFSDAYIVRLIEGISQELNKHRIQLVIQSVRLDQSNYLQLARQDNVDGIILLNTHDNDEGLSEIIEADFPLVVIGSLSDRTICQVDIDNMAASKKVTEHLINLGHKRIAMIIHAPIVYYAARMRYKGYREAMEEAGLAVSKQWICEGDFSEQSGYSAMQKLLCSADSPTAVFAGNDMIAYGAVKAVKDAGMNIPSDISIAGFDDDFLSRYLNPPLTTMSLPAAGLGSTASRLLINCLLGKKPPKEKKIILPTHLSVRESCKTI